MRGALKLSAIPSNPYAIFSYGAPRVGNRPYTKVLSVKHYRWVNNNDIVPRIPPRWFGYRHMGQEIYLNRAPRLDCIVFRCCLAVHSPVYGSVTPQLAFT